MRKITSFFKKNEKGFTLAELIVSASLTCVFMAAFVAAFIGLRNGMYAQDSYFTSNRTGYYTMNVISKDVREALSIEDTYGVSTATSVLVLRLPSINASGVPTNVASQYDYVVYQLSGTTPNNLTRTVTALNGSSRNSVSNQIVARNVTGFTLSNSSGTPFSSLIGTQQEALKIFNVALTSSETVGDQARTITIDSDMVVMNK